MENEIDNGEIKRQVKKRATVILSITIAIVVAALLGWLPEVVWIPMGIICLFAVALWIPEPKKEF